MGGGKRHLVIGGTGRAGTTVLVELLGDLGLDIGRDRLNYFPEAHAGLESDITRPDAAYVVKRPALDLGAAVDAGLDPSTIDVLVVPVRKLEQAALSRKHRARANNVRGLDEAGALTGTRNPWRQGCVLAKQVHHLLEDAAEYEVPVRLVAYPRFALDADYAFRQVAPLLGRPCDREEFMHSWGRVIDPSLVHADDLQGSLLLDVHLALRALLLTVGRPAKAALRTLRG